MTSLEGEGACFAVWLPLLISTQAEHLLPHYEHAAASASSEATERIALVIEDDDQAAELLRLLLVSEGFTSTLPRSVTTTHSH